MQIKNMFEKKIDRDIKGVIKVGQSDEENVYQELDEYVVTKELLKHFRDFFNNYEKGVDGYTDKMGVWISGFFGSGKSHFLKILSYLLKNSTVEGKRAIEYFTDGKKIEDPMLIAEMTKAGTIESDVMLFNIDSKGSAKVGSGKEAIVEVFMKVFNEMQGYCGSIPYLAEFERQLDNEGRFEEFKEKFEANAGAPWEKKRQAFVVIQDKVVKTLVEMNFMSEEAARNWCKNAKGNYDLSIEKFVSLVQEYCAKKGPNHHVIFLVDEIGQYIADDTQLMLNLQTIVEDLGTACKGKAWVIVTSQEDIDSITKTKGNDFSKIQGRFDTRLSLSASNVDEVIRKRVLAKNETATQILRLLYEQKESIIKNLITFTADTADKKLYADKADFADCYPFIPYQFNLLGQVLTAVRTHGASGKHLSDQSRSMLALFQESAIRVMDKEDARNKLISSVTDKAGMLGITPDNCSEAITKGADFEVYRTAAGTEVTLNKKQCEQRRKLVDQIQARGFEAVVEEVAYTWFNRICAIRFMEVNDYMYPVRVRVLSSEKEGKNEPDVVTMAPDIDWDFTDKEREEIIDAKMNNRLDDLFRMLFIKQCNLLHEVLPGLFEETEDYTEMLLNISFTNEDDVIRMLVDGIDGKDFNITTVDEDGKTAGQVEIIGWLYQYYNTEPKNKAFAKKAKITKEEVPAVTQLFTPDWIVRYMVENSLGRMWVEGHPDDELKSKWKYYLDEEEQEESVQQELDKIKVEYATLKPEDIKLIDPCMGSGHILVYAFDVFMQIYENAGWSQRDAAQSIIQNNIYGLDIDDRAAQLSYFAVLMKARQYDRRILTMIVFM